MAARLGFVRRRPHHHSFVYQSWKHVWVTIGFVMLPFVYMVLFARLTETATDRLLWDLTVSCGRLFIAYAIAAVIGWLLAVSFYRGKRAIVALPVLDVLQSFPTFAALPLAIAIWGPSNITTIVFLVLTIIWPIVFSMLSTLKMTKHEWHEVAQMSGLSGWTYVRRFLFPLTFPAFITGSIVGLGEGWEALVATEMIVGLQTGLGPFFERYAERPTITTFGILGFLLLIFVVNKLVWIPLLEWSHRRLED